MGIVVEEAACTHCLRMVGFLAHHALGRRFLPWLLDCKYFLCMRLLGSLSKVAEVQQHLCVIDYGDARALANVEAFLFIVVTWLL